MRRPVAGVWNVPLEGVAPALATTSICFFLGGLAGVVLAANVGGSGTDSLSAYIRAFLAAAKAGTTTAPTIIPLVWEVFRWPLFTIIFGFTALGLIGIPVLFTVRGFLLSFSISSFIHMLGGTGGLLALLVFGVSGLVAVPSLFILGVQGLAASRSLAGGVLGESRRNSPFGKAYFLRCGMCAGAFCVCVLLEYLVVPAFVAGLASILPA